jgi:hypothetical protein
MVLYTISKHVTNWMGPRLFRAGLLVRHRLTTYFIKPLEATANYHQQHKNSTLDILCGLPIAQRLTSLVLYERSREYIDANDDYNTMVQKRLHILNETLRPIFLSPTTGSKTAATASLTAHEAAIAHWKDNVYVLKWLREQTLLARYGPLVKEALDAYPQLRHSPQLSRPPMQHQLLQLARGRIELSFFNKASDTPQLSSSKSKPRNLTPMLLPSSDTIIKAFQMKEWAKEKRKSKQRVSRLDNDEFHGDSKDGSQAFSMVDILDAATKGRGGYIPDLGPFNVVCEEANMYQWWTKEYVEGLGMYIMQRKPDLVLDVGAGDGILLENLRQYYHRQQQKQQQQETGKRTTSSSTIKTRKIEWIAADDASWRIFPKAPVEKLTVEQTLEKYVVAEEGGSSSELDNRGGDHDGSAIASSIKNQKKKLVIVICSWMPMGQDWTRLFREAGVDEYILIGEADDGSCGHVVETWGQNSVDNDTGETVPPAYETSGYWRRDLVDLHPYQLSRFDTKQSKNGMTVSFRKSPATI